MLPGEAPHARGQTGWSWAWLRNHVIGTYCWQGVVTAGCRLANPKVSTLLEAGLSLCGWLGHAGEPGLARHCSAWKLPASTGSRSPERWEQQGSLHLSKLPASLPCAPTSTPACTAGQGLLCPGSQRPLGPTGPKDLWVLLCRAAALAVGKAPVSTAPSNTLPALPCLRARSWRRRGAGQPLTDSLAHCVLRFRPRPLNPFAVGGEDLDPFG